MTVVALAIEPGCSDARLPRDLASRLGLRLLDFRRFERDMGWRSDDSLTHQRPHELVKLSSSRHGHLRITIPQLGHRYAEMVLRSAADGNALIVSWLAPVLLATVGNVLSVRLGAPVKHRTSVLMKQLGYRDIETARLELASADSLLSRLVARTTGECWSDMGHYDLVLNAARTPQELCVRTIAFLAAAPQFRPNAAETEALESECLKYSAGQDEEFAVREPQFYGIRPLVQPSAS